MKTVTVRRHIPAPVEKVFDVLTDHANYDQLPGIKHSELVTPGTETERGVGAIRIIDAGTMKVTEEITAFEPNERMDYRIIRARPPVRHEGGSLTFTPNGDGTDVEWTSTAQLAIPVIGTLLSGFFAGQLEKAFAGMLKSVERKLA